MIAQQIVSGRATALLAANGVTPDRLLATPTPFNTLLWRAIVIDGERSFNLYMPIFGGPEKATLYAYDRKLELKACAENDPRIAKVAHFSQGFYRMMERDGAVVIADLRMGLSPNYAFRFALGRLEDGTLVPASARRLEGRGDIDRDLDWLFANLRGEPATRLAEADAKVEPARYAALATSGARPTRAC